MMNYGDLGGCYSPRPTASTDNTLLDLHNFFIRYSASFINCFILLHEKFLQFDWLRAVVFQLNLNKQ